MLSAIIQTVNNREVSMAFYLGLLTLYLLSSADVRAALSGLIKALLNKYLLSTIVLYLSFISLLIYFVIQLGIFDPRLFKNLILWLMLTGIWLPISSSLSDPKAQPIKDILKKNFRIVIVLQFMAGSYTFSLLTEMILTPILILFAGLEAFASVKEPEQMVHRFSRFVNAVLSLVILLSAILLLIQNYHSTDFPFMLKRFLFPIGLSLVTIPFLYAVRLYSAYEQLFLRLTARTRDNNLQQYLRKRLKRFCGTNAKKVHLVTFSRVFNSSQIETKADVNDLLGHLKRELT